MPCNCHPPIPPRPQPAPTPCMPPHQTPTYVGPCACAPLPPHYWHPFAPGPCGCCPPPPPQQGPWQYTPSHLYPNYFNVCGWQRYIPPYAIFMPNQPVPGPCQAPVPFDPRLRW